MWRWILFDHSIIMVVAPANALGQLADTYRSTHVLAPTESTDTRAGVGVGVVWGCQEVIRGCQPGSDGGVTWLSIVRYLPLVGISSSVGTYCPRGRPPVVTVYQNRKRRGKLAGGSNSLKTAGLGERPVAFKLITLSFPPCMRGDWAATPTAARRGLQVGGTGPGEAPEMSRRETPYQTLLRHF